MKIVIAPDSFKESLSASAVAAAIASGLRQAAPDVECLCIPMADGGEGTVDAILAATGGQRRTNQVEDALGRPIQAQWGWLPGKVAVIEMACAAGLEHIDVAERDPLRASSFGVGQLIRHALDLDAEKIVLGLGGSATNDAGAGMLQALGLRLMDAEGRALPPGGSALARLAKIDHTQFDPRLSQVEFTIASDVNNPLCGPNGASEIFGPQKGATPEQVKLLDQALEHFAEMCANVLAQDYRQVAGAGAAGGLGFAAHGWLHAHFRPGVEVVAELGGLAHAIEGAQLVITGEGRMDAQTLQGKTPMGVAKIAQAAGVPVIAIAGSLGDGYQALYSTGIIAAFSLVSGPTTLEQACANAEELLQDRAQDILRLWLAAKSTNSQNVGA